MESPIDLNALPFVVTGASGFVGRNLLRIPGAIGVSRKEIPVWTRNTDFTPFLAGARAVVHAAGPAHGKARDSSDLFCFHVEVTRKLIEDACKVGVKHFVLISSAAVYGLPADGSLPITELVLPHPESPYAHAKREAEKVLTEFCSVHPSMHYTILRPAMIYGPHAPGTPAKIRRFLGLGIPLPFGALEAKRSALNIDLLVETVRSAVQRGTHPPVHNPFLGRILNIADSPAETVGALFMRLAPPSRRALVIRAPASGVRALLQPLRWLKATRGVHGQLFDSFVLDTASLESLRDRSQD